MPFEIVRNNIADMDVDAIVNTANPKPVVGSGVDREIHNRAGEALLEARQKIGAIPVGETRCTPGFDLPAQYVLHACGPVYVDGQHHEEELFRKTIDSALFCALEHGCSSVAFPLMGTGNYGFPKSRALSLQVQAFSDFLMEHEMLIYLVVFDRESFELSEKLFSSVKSYIDLYYVEEKMLQEYPKKRLSGRFNSVAPLSDMFVGGGSDSCCKTEDLGSLLSDLDAGFSETLLKLMDRTGEKDSTIYKRANVDRKLFSKIRNNPQYRPTKQTAIAFALALKLDLEETEDLIGRAGYALSHSSKFDVIVEWYIENGYHDVMELNEVLFKYDQPLIGA